MSKISYSGYRFPPEIIQQAVWLYLRFTLSFRHVEDWLAERGILVSYETVRRWVNHFGPKITADLRKRRSKPHTIWHFRYAAERYGSRSVYCRGGEGSALTKWTSRTNPEIPMFGRLGNASQIRVVGVAGEALEYAPQIPSLAHRVKCLSEIVPRSAATTAWHSQSSGCPCQRRQPIGSERCYERVGSGKECGTSFSSFAHSKAMAEGVALHHRARAHNIRRGLYQHFAPAPRWLLGIPSSGDGSCLHRHGMASCSKQGSSISDALDASAPLGGIFGRDEHTGII